MGKRTANVIAQPKMNAPRLVLIVRFALLFRRAVMVTADIKNNSIDSNLQYNARTTKQPQKNQLSIFPF